MLYHVNVVFALLKLFGGRYYKLNVSSFIKNAVHIFSFHKNKFRLQQ